MKAKLYQIHYKLHPLKYYQWTVDHVHESPGMYMTTIYHYFCIKMNTFRLFFKVKNV